MAKRCLSLVHTWTLLCVAKEVLSSFYTLLHSPWSEITDSKSNRRGDRNNNKEDTIMIHVGSHSNSFLFFFIEVKEISSHQLVYLMFHAFLAVQKDL